MQRAVQLARDNNVRIGAHISYPDLINFGREVLQMPPAALRYSLVEQLRRLKDVTLKHGARMVYVKPHGALYNQAHKDPETAEVVLDAIRRFDDSLPIMCMPGSVIGSLAHLHDLTVIREGFADRAYLADGSLAPRALAGAVHTNPELVAAQALALSRHEPIQTLDGATLQLRVESVCIHSDTEGALRLIQATRRAFDLAEIEVAC
jgi:UPF0271 protein